MPETHKTLPVLPNLQLTLDLQKTFHQKESDQVLSKAVEMNFTESRDPPTAARAPHLPSFWSDDDKSDNDNNEKNSQGSKERDEQAERAKVVPQQPKRTVNRRPKPKLTFEHLEGVRGCPAISEEFLEPFRSQFKGEGHERTDLGTLISMYESWQKRMYGFTSFNEFIPKMEKMGSKKEGQNILGAARQNVYRLVQSLTEEQENQHPTSQANIDEDNENVNEENVEQETMNGMDGMNGIDGVDDELVALQMETMEDVLDDQPPDDLLDELMG